MAMQRIRKGDQVIVVAGAQKGTIGQVSRVLPDDGQVVVEGVRTVRRHRKPTGDQPGSIVEKQLPIDVSNVALWNAEEGRRVKVGFKQEGKKRVRVDRKTGARID